MRKKIREVSKKREDLNLYLRSASQTEAGLLAQSEEKSRRLEEVQDKKVSLAKRVYEVEKLFGSLEEAKRYMLSVAEFNNLKEEINSYRLKLSDLLEERKKREEKLAEFVHLRETQEVQKELSAVEEKTYINRQEKGKREQELKEGQERLLQKERLLKELEELKEELSLYRTLKEDLTDNRFPEYLSQIMLRKIVERASYYLFKFSSGSYQLELVEGSLKVLSLQTGAYRVVSSLSGGETFLASLSFAFAVADLMSNNSPLESLFIDEGFGSLDRETRDSLGEFFEMVKQATNRAVGIITHVEDVAERFDQRVEVEKTPSGSRLKVIY